MLLKLSENMQDFRNLVHGDFGSNNVLYDGTSITGVIDWSEGHDGDPLYDVANIFFWRTWLDCMDLLASFLERYGRFQPGQANAPRLLSTSHWSSRSLWQRISRGLSHEPEWAIARLEEILSQAQ